MSGRCNYCRRVNGSTCGARIRTTKPELEFRCTADPGHRGPHTRCDGRHPLVRWEKAPEGSTLTAMVAGYMREAVVVTSS